MRIFWMDTAQGVRLPVVMLAPGRNVAATLLEGQSKRLWSSAETYALFNSSFEELTDFLYNKSALWGHTVFNNGRNLTLGVPYSDGDRLYLTINPDTSKVDSSYGGDELEPNGTIEFVKSDSKPVWISPNITDGSYQGQYNAYSQNVLNLTPVSNGRVGLLIMDDNQNMMYASLQFENDFVYIPGQGANLTTLGVQFSTYWMGFVDMDIGSQFWKDQTGTIEDYGPAPEPEPEPSEGGGIVSLENRFSPRIKSGAFGIYPLDNDQVQAVISDLWSTGLFEAFNYEILGSPLDSIMSVKWYYGIKSDIRTTSGSAYLTLGNIQFNGQLGTAGPIITKPALSEFVNITMGDVIVPIAGGPKFLSTSPYNEIQIYIPYVGFVSIDSTNLYGRRLRLDYNLNIGTGTAIAYVYSAPADTENWRVEMEIPCEMGTDIPLNINSKESLQARITNSVVGISATVVGAAGGLGGLYTASRVAGNTSNGARSQRVREDAGDDADRLNNLSDMGDVSLPRADFKRSGGASSESGSLAYLKPFLLVAKADVAVDVESFRSSVGLADYKAGTVSELFEGGWNGPYLEIGSFVTQDNIDIPRVALEEIYSIMKAGVRYDR